LEIESILARAAQILLALGGAYFIATWFVLALWTYRDIEARSKNVATQIFSTLLSVFFWVPGVLLYMMLRPKETLDEAYQRSLEEEYLLQDLQGLPLCPTCNHFVHDDWQLCPHCNTQLREACDNCGHLVDLRWDICPYCGQEQEVHETHVHEPKEVASKDGWIDPAIIEKRLRDEQARIERSKPRALPAATAIDRDILSPAAANLERQTTTVRATPSRQTEELPNVGKAPVGPDVTDLGAANGSESGELTDGPVKIPRKFRLRSE
jgi:RNA polymerase subunit RPABC4/transcription elongation factor Spt4